LRKLSYLTGRLFPEPLPVFLLLETAGGGWLLAPDGLEGGCVEEVLTYSWNELGTNHFDPLRRLDTLVARRAGGAKPIRRLGWQEESLARTLAETITRTLAPADWVAVNEVLRDLQRAKDPDELDLLRRSIASNLGVYEAACAAIRPGATELEVLAAGRRGALLTAREQVFHDGDYQSGAYNSPAPTSIPAQVRRPADRFVRLEKDWSPRSSPFLPIGCVRRSRSDQRCGPATRDFLPALRSPRRKY
jgi:hypothetical protein